MSLARGVDQTSLLPVLERVANVGSLVSRIIAIGVNWSFRVVAGYSAVIRDRIVEVAFVIPEVASVGVCRGELWIEPNDLVEIRNGFDVDITFDVDQSATGGQTMRFDAHGQLSSTGGQLSIDEQDSQSTTGGQDGGCKVTIEPNKGVVKKGSVWATFECDDFRDPSSASGSSCVATGAFLLENCSS